MVVYPDSIRVSGSHGRILQCQSLLVGSQFRETVADFFLPTAYMTLPGIMKANQQGGSFGSVPTLFLHVLWPKHVVSSATAAYRQVYTLGWQALHPQSQLPVSPVSDKNIHFWALPDL